MCTDTQVWKKRGKDASPEQTVEHILRCLKAAGIETEYEEFKTTVENCHSGRVTLKAPYKSSIGANGKGMTSAMCKASAYAELMERLQNILFAERIVCCDPMAAAYVGRNGQPVFHLNDVDEPEVIRELRLKIAKTCTGLPLWMNAENVVNRLLHNVSYKAAPGAYTTRRFYSLRQKKMVSLPIELIQFFCLSNGMAAGNTLEEAIVQACSEIFERYSEYRFLQGDLTPPEIPRAILSRFDKVSAIIRTIEADGRYRVSVRDCSLGKGLPVVCGIITDTERQTFGVKFGAYPDMEVALERVFSEAMQGNNLESFTHQSVATFERITDARINSWNLVKVGVGAFPAALLGDKPIDAFVPWPDVSGMKNRELMHMMLNLLTKMGADVYISDVSFLGFPSVMVYAAGVSETVPLDFLQLKELNLTLEGPELCRGEITRERIQKLLTLSIIKRYAMLENSFSIISGIYSKKNAPGYPSEAVFLTAVCQYTLGQFEQAADTARLYMNLCKDLPYPESIYARGCCMMMEARVGAQSADSAAAAVRMLCPADIADRVIHDLAEPEKALTAVYHFCPDFACEICDYSDCEYEKVRNLYLQLSELEAKAKLPEEKLMELFAQ